MEHIEYYEVRKIRSSFLIYAGTSMGKAADMLDVGSCYSKGLSAKLAHNRVMSEVARFQKGTSKPLVIPV